ncbi:rhamnulose-1-phosphate aldolase [Ruegeria atlantica]|uniref:Rhamnulose-1-phosphate aldolase n=1 Tax=Ruegeria atlantica TaxID=81569 RepID=A0A0N7LNL2_9RHOB|nr:rhamnulose-1-phosphate aldolase [Ruegeria atlantica]CUH42732.1 Rhamnulose-1-phosphate aldolase [Ruegeria atlantica]
MDYRAHHTIPVVQEASRLLRLCWKLGWNEANGGNFSWRLPEEVLESFPRTASDPIALEHPHPNLDGEFILITASGQCFRHARARPDEVFGVVRIIQGGHAYQAVWGFANGGKPTSEMAMHLVGHAIRKEVSGGRERAILHCHPPEFITLSFVMPLQSRSFSLALWQTMPECIVIFPDGVRIVLAMLPGTDEIARASAEGLKESRIVSWTHHGIFASEEDPDKAFALVETIEKASSIQRKIMSVGGAQRGIDIAMLKELTQKFRSIMVCEPRLLGEPVTE